MKPLSLFLDKTLATLSGVAAKKAPTRLSSTHDSSYPNYLPVSHTPKTATTIEQVSFVWLNELNKLAGGTISNTDVLTIDALTILIDWANIITPTMPMIEPHI